MEVEKVNTYKAQLDFFCSEEVDRYCLEITTNLSKQELVSKMKKWNQRLNENEVYEEEGFNCDTILSYVKTHDPKLQWTVLVSGAWRRWKQPVSWELFPKADRRFNRLF